MKERPLKPAAVLDTAALVSGYVNPSYENYTVSEVLEELKRFGVNFEEAYFSCLVHLAEPSKKYVEYVKNYALKTGDYKLLSKTDLLLAGLAVELRDTRKTGVVVFTDDYALANLAKFLGIDHSFVGLYKPGFKFISWVWFCPTCHRIYLSEARFCEDCGSELKRKPK